MTDLERVRDALEWHEYGNQDERRRLAFLELDAHLKEDAERDRALEAYVAQGPTDQEARQLYIEEHNARVKAEAELARLRAENKRNAAEADRVTKLLSEQVAELARLREENASLVDQHNRESHGTASHEAMAYDQLKAENARLLYLALDHVAENARLREQLQVAESYLQDRQCGCPDECTKGHYYCRCDDRSHIALHWSGPDTDDPPEPAAPEVRLQTSA